MTNARPGDRVLVIWGDDETLALIERVPTGSAVATVRDFDKHGDAYEVELREADEEDRRKAQGLSLTFQHVGIPTRR